MEIKGTVHEVGSTIQVTDTFKKRELIVEYAENPQYPEFIKFEAVQDRTTLLDNVKVGDTVTVAFNLRGREYKDKEGKTAYFNSLGLWKIAVEQTGERTPEFAKPVDFNTLTPDEDDLPF